MKNDRQQGKTSNKQRNRIRNHRFILDFSARFHEMLRELRFTQKAMAEKLGGFSVQAINRLVRDNTKSIPIDMMVNLAKFAASHNISINWLLTGHGAMKITTEGGEGTQGPPQVITSPSVVKIPNSRTFDKIDLIPVSDLRKLRAIFLRASHQVDESNALSILLTRTAVDMDVLIAYCEAGRMQPMSSP